MRALVVGFATWQVASGAYLALGADSAVQQVALVAHLTCGLALALALGPYLRAHWRRVRASPRVNARALGLAAALLVTAAVLSGLTLLARAAGNLPTGDDWRTYHWGLGLAAGGALAVHLAVVAARAWMPAAFLVAATCAAVVAVAGAASRGAVAPGAPRAVKAPDAWRPPPNAQCGACHAATLAEWRGSGHGRADSDPYYLALEAKLARAKDFAAVAYCNECHDPLLVAGGGLAQWRAAGGAGPVPHTGEAVSCATCHAMTHASGNRDRGNYTLGQPRRGLLEDTAAGQVLLRAYPRPHRAEQAQKLYERSRMCAGCHRADVGQDIPGFGYLRIENPHARWALANVKPACQECHAPHGFAGSTDDLLAGRVPLPNVKGDLTRGPLIELIAGRPQGGALPLTLRHTGRIGHQFPTGAQDLIQVWVEGEAKAGDRTVARWGEAKPGGPLLPGTPVFRRGGLRRGPNGPVEVVPAWQLEGVPFPVLRPHETRTVNLPLAIDSKAFKIHVLLYYRKLSAGALAAMGGTLPLPPRQVIAELSAAP